MIGCRPRRAGRWISAATDPDGDTGSDLALFLGGSGRVGRGELRGLKVKLGLQRDDLRLHGRAALLKRTVAALERL
jgi:hypothetical protein